MGSTSYITDVFGTPVQYIEYLPFGEVMVEESNNNMLENVYKFNSKELDAQTGYYYYGARYYDPGTSIFLSVDPLADQFPGWNPYHYVHNNPINLIDPTGMAAEEVIIKGEKKQEAFKQLQSSTKLNLTMDDATGKVDTNDKRGGSKSDKTLFDAIKSPTVQVNVNATDSNYYNGTETPLVIGAYEGSTIDESGKVIANQTINTVQAGIADEFYKMGEGTTTKHEVLEAFIGAKKSPGIIINQNNNNDDKSKEYKAYMKAHKATMKLDRNFVQPEYTNIRNNLYFLKPNKNIPDSPFIQLFNNLK
ncbi:RHS repeat domain-containing protein [Myroides odoratus]